MFDSADMTEMWDGGYRLEEDPPTKIDIIDKFETIKICKEKANIFFARLKTYKAARLEQQCEENW